MSDHLEKDLGYKGSAANAVKHAYAAAELYNFFCFIGMAEDAEEYVLLLGILNEYLERITKYTKPDSPKEIMKDLHNNYVGILAASWHQKQKPPKRDLLRVIMNLADQNILITNRDDSPYFNEVFFAKSDAVSVSNHWFLENKTEIKNRTNLALSNFR